MDKETPKAGDWKWRYSFWTGIMYGPIPVGLIIVAFAVLCYVVYALTK